MFGINKNGTKHKIGIIMPASYPASRLSYESVSITADGVKTTQTVLNELFALVDLNKVNRNSVFVMTYGGIQSVCHVAQIQSSEVTFIGWTADDGTTYTDVNIFSLRQATSNRAILRLSVSGMQRLDRAQYVAPNSMTFTLYY